MTGEGLQLLPPGTQRPAWPLAALQASCFRLVSGTQQVPLGVGRLPFWRAARTESWGKAEAMATMPKRMVAMDSFMLTDFGLKEIKSEEKRMYVLGKMTDQRNE